MLVDFKPSISVSPSKGKAKEDNHWRSGWWDFYPLAEPVQTPIQWSSGSIIFTAHPAQPSVLARLFSSSKQFVLPSASQIQASPAAYKPPTIISVCPDDGWLFAYFPAVENTMPLAVLWKRGLKVDEWYVRESWGFERWAEVVAAGWAGTEREWAADNAGYLTRLPHRGPHNPISNPTLLLVTQSHHLHVCYLRTYFNSKKSISCLLTRSSHLTKSQSDRPHEVSYGPGGARICSKAVIELEYNDSSILVAMHSKILPCPVGKSAMYDLNPALDTSQQGFPPFSEYDAGMEWESWGEESTIELCEVRLNFDVLSGIGLSTNPLPPIHLSKGSLTNLSFICTPPITQPSLFRSRAEERTAPSNGNSDIERGRTYLCASFLDFGDYSSTPKSELVLHSISRTRSVSGKPTWVTQHEATRSYSAGVITFFAPCMTDSSNIGLYVGILDTSGNASRRNAKKTVVGNIVVLNLPDLSDDGEWQSSPIVSSVDNIGRDLPLIAAISPNRTLVCTISSLLPSTPISIHHLPSRSRKDSSGQPTVISSRPFLSTVLASAILSRRTVTDLLHTISHPSTHLDDVTGLLYHTLSTLEGSSGGMSGMWTWEILGVSVEIYRMRIRRAKNGTNLGVLTGRWQTAHDMCSLAACNMAFEDCKEGDAYDLEAIWQLVALSSWVVDFLEKLMRDCILSHSDEMASSPPLKVEDSDDLFGSVPPTPNVDSTSWALPMLLHLVQPYALANLTAAVKHVKRFHAHLRALTAKEENAQIAKDVLVDLVDCSGIELNGLESLLTDLAEDAQMISEDDGRTSLASCQPISCMIPTLRKMVQKLIDSSILDKSRLFVKSSDLVDWGSPRILIQRKVKEEDRDVVSKGLLMKNGPKFHCQRCGGRSEIGGNMGVAGRISLRWRAWEKVWTTRCICGGAWTVMPTYT